MELKIKPLKYKSVAGISERQLAEHHDVLYAGYVKKYNEITEQLKQVDLSVANATYSHLRELMVEKGFALNGIKLHEAYFDNLTDTPAPIDGPIKQKLVEQWGSVEAWQEEFASLGLSARGWVALVYDYDLEQLAHYIYDAHNQGGVANTKNLLVMDVYEHAYFIDFGTARKDYIGKFMQAIDWSIVNARLAE